MISSIGDQLKSLITKDQLSPQEINKLVYATRIGYFGNGLERKVTLGKWYDIAQDLVNARMTTAVRLPPVKKMPIFCRLRREFVCRRRRSN